ncbi:MAG: N-6 DNA methylase, partial [Thermomicrobiales bacterium]
DEPLPPDQTRSKSLIRPVDGQDEPGFCKSARLEEIKGHNYVLTPGRYVGAKDVEEDDVPFVDRFVALKAKLEEQFAASNKLTETIRLKLEGVAANE